MNSKQTSGQLLNESECAEILKNYLKLIEIDQQLNLINFRIKPITHETMGYLGEYYLLNITAKMNEGKEENYEFFIKTLPVKNEEHRKIIEEMGFFVKEANLYKKLLKELKKYEVLKWYPDCFYIRNDIIVMENLLNYNYKHLKSDETITKDHLKIILRSIASMHASCLVLEEKNSINIGEKYKEYLFEPSFVRDNGWFNAGLQGIKYIASVHPKYQTASYQTFIREKLLQTIDPIYEMVHTTKYRRVFVHRDVWGKNMFFKFHGKNSMENNSETTAAIQFSDQDECVFVDFQIARYQPPAMDVIFSIISNTDRALRDMILEECLKYYYDCLNQFVNVFEINLLDLNLSWTDFRESCDFIKLPCFVLNCVYAPLTYLSCDIWNDIKRNNPDKFNRYLNYDRIELIKEQMNKNQIFRDHLFEIVEELIEFVIDF